MESNNSPSQQPVPRQPQPGMQPRPVQVGHRPTMDGFVPHRPTTPSSPVRRPAPSMDGMSAPMQSRPQPQPRPVTPAVPSPTPAPAAARPVTVHHQASPNPQPNHFAQVPQSQQPRPFAARPASPFGNAVAKPVEEPRPSMTTSDSDPDMMPASKARGPKEHDSTGHAGLVGLAAFIVFGTLLLSPIIPGHVSQGFPLSSSSVTTGQQSLDCLNSENNIQNVTTYTSKYGSPITYTSGTKLTQTANCDNTTQSAIVETTSQFNPLGLVLDLVVALAAAIVIARVWRLVFGERRFKPRRRGREELKD
jgi:hypothetical protein